MQRLIISVCVCVCVRVRACVRVPCSLCSLHSVSLESGIHYQLTGMSEYLQELHMSPDIQSEVIQI